MTAKCKSIRGCPASLYLDCPAYLAGRSCFEYGVKCPDCDGNCSECEVYRVLSSEADRRGDET